MINKIIEWSVKNRFFVFLTGIFVIGLSIWSIKNMPLDAIPDLTDTQVIIYSTWDRPPQVIEDQITYPIISALLGAPKVRDIRGFSDYGFSFIYVIFEDGTDIYWARARVIEYLSKILPQLPEGVKTQLGPDATGVGWVYQYVLVDETGKYSSEQLRSFQDWNLKYLFQTVKGVAEVASIGGFKKQYQIILDPQALLIKKISIDDVIDAVKKSNNTTGARLLEFAGAEYMVNIGGYFKSLNDIEEVVVKIIDGVPIKIKDIAKVNTGPDIRRGIADYNGYGDAPGGIVVMRYGENALKVIENIKKKIEDIKLPDGVKLISTYDRSELIKRAIFTLKKKLIEEMIVVSLVIIIFLMHLPSALIPILLLPAAVLISFIPMKIMGVTANIMSLGGIAIAIGAMVDAAIVVIENVHKKLAKSDKDVLEQNRDKIILDAIKEVGGPSFYTLLVIAVSFLPIFALEGMEGRLFKPLAYTKNFSMFFAAILAITLGPVLVFTLIKNNVRNPFLKIISGQIMEEEKHPISKFLFKLYEPIITFVLKKPVFIIVCAIILMLATIPVFFMIGREFMPPLNEGSILYMPTTNPGISVTQAYHLMHQQDKILKTFPEVISVHGKAGRAETATDPAPFSMMETTIVLKPQNEWREKKRWYSFLPEFFKPPLRLIWNDKITWEELIAEMDEKLKLPGVVNAWTMPIKGRIDMLTTGIRTPIGIKIYGEDLAIIEKIGKEIEALLTGIKGTRSVYAEKTAGGYFVNFDINRSEIARYGLTIEDVQMQIMYAIGGENITYTIEGRERYSVNLRYPRDLRDDIDKLKKMLISTPAGQHIPISQVAHLYYSTGPAMIRNENGKLAGYVYVDVVNRDLGGYVNEIKKIIKNKLNLPAGYSIAFSGQYEFMERVKKKMVLVVPLTLFIIFILLYLNTRSYIKTAIVLLAVPFSLIGVVWILFLSGYNFSLGVWVGIIALLGIDAETGVFMLLYLDIAYKNRKGKNISDLQHAIHEGAVKRIRPKMMTVITTFMGLLPIMWAATHEIGADVMKRIAAPMVGGILTSFILELVVYPAIYFLWKKNEIERR